MANRVRQRIRKEIGDAKFSILVDETRDASSQEQMTIILRFMNGNGILTEHFFAIKSVSDTTSLNLKNQISDVLDHFNLQVQNMRGQRYDGANNMRGAWNGLLALFLRDCPYAYYVNCFVRRLQLTLVSVARDIADINSFFSDLDNVINIIASSPKCINELKNSKKKKLKLNICWKLENERLEVGLIKLITCNELEVFEYLSDHSPNVRTRSEVGDVLCQALQKKTQDILTVMRFVHTTKTIIQELREDRGEEFLEEMNCFCSKNDIHISDFHGSYMVGRSRGFEYPTIEHHYHFDIFNVAIDFLMTELDTRFNEI
ncbi:zinc finger MYM-type protein 1-like [Olea europaea var. sylvestris]|uniref:zinc finger MYM-type protein 1-like n=1 Tax=Olea europaea var. sylvestris TaxID=158386 RepID=UPI000C1D21C4|nr:zinc finger MYM-type protein 1-like [Olea europaea var. sylvestris]